MQQVVNSMIGYTVRGIDGDLGKVKEFYFDDATWIIRYMAVETGNWLSNRKVLISMSAMGKSNLASHVININLTREQVSNSPDVGTDKLVSRKFESALHKYYEWNSYWNGGFYILPGYGMGSALLAAGDTETEEESLACIRKIDPLLRSTREISGYRIHAIDGDIGHVDDFIVDEDGWNIRYLVVDIRNWLPGRRVVISPQWIMEVDWNNAKVFVDISCDAVKNSPRYDPSKLISLDYERKLLEHLRKPESPVWVTFKIHEPHESKVFLAGSFNNWDPSSIRLERDIHGVYGTTVLIPAGRIEYKFIVNGIWRNAPECKDLVPNSFGTTNSVMIVGQGTDHMGHAHTFSRFSAGQNRPLWSTPMGG